MHFIFKMSDGSAVDPVSKKPLCMDGVYTNIQWRNNVFPTQILISKETKASYDSFKDFLIFLPWQVIKL